LSGILPPGSDVSLAGELLILQTNPVPTTGKYFVSAGALIDISSSDGFAFCFDTTASSGTASMWGGADLSGSSSAYQQVSLSDVLSVNAGDSIQMWCESGSSGSTLIFNAGLTATLINSSNKAQKGHAQRQHETPQQAQSR
jgi:hypothetical protein